MHTSIKDKRAVLPDGQKERPNTSHVLVPSRPELINIARRESFSQMI
jgi:hypothetical protein